MTGVRQESTTKRRWYGCYPSYSTPLISAAPPFPFPPFVYAWRLAPGRAPRVSCRLRLVGHREHPATFWIKIFSNSLCYLIGRCRSLKDSCNWKLLAGVKWIWRAHVISRGVTPTRGHWPWVSVARTTFEFTCCLYLSSSPLASHRSSDSIIESRDLYWLNRLHLVEWKSLAK